MADRLRAGGIVLLDIYHREAVSALPAEEDGTRAGHAFSTRRRMDGDRFQVRIDYAFSDDVDGFEWQVFTPGEIEALGAPSDSVSRWRVPGSTRRSRPARSTFACRSCSSACQRPDRKLGCADRFDARAAAKETPT